MLQLLSAGRNCFDFSKKSLDILSITDFCCFRCSQMHPEALTELCLWVQYILLNWLLTYILILWFIFLNYPYQTRKFYDLVNVSVYEIASSGLRAPKNSENFPGAAPPDHAAARSVATPPRLHSTAARSAALRATSLKARRILVPLAPHQKSWHPLIKCTGSGLASVRINDSVQLWDFSFLEGKLKRQPIVQHAIYNERNHRQTERDR